MKPIPQDGGVDNSLSFLREGYEFGLNRFERYETDIFATRLMLSRAVFVRGEEAGRMFYEPGRFTRRGALPPHTLRLLQDKKSALTLDGARHEARKRILLSTLTQEKVGELVGIFEARWRERMAQWTGMERVNLLGESEIVLGRAVLEWSGFAVSDEEADEVSRELGAMIAGAGSRALRMIPGLVRRSKAESWVKEKIEAVREGRLQVKEDSAVGLLAMQTQEGGKELPEEVVRVELLNLLRPVVAVGRFIVFEALALHLWPALQDYVRGGDERAVTNFANEVRRYFPFFPAVGGKAVEAFEWHGHGFSKGDWVMLDIFATNHDERLWAEPTEFRPERFSARAINDYNLIPQGGGKLERSHRCAGEEATVELMKSAARLLTREMSYEVPEQDLSVRCSKMPAQPESGFELTRVRSV